MYTLEDKLNTNRLIAESIIPDTSKKRFGFNKSKNLIRSESRVLDEVKGIPFKYTHESVSFLLKVLPIEVDKSVDNSLIEIAYMSLFTDEILLKNVSPNFPYFYTHLDDVPNDSPCFSNIQFKNISRINKIEKFSNVLLCEYVQEKDIDIWYMQNDLLDKHWKSIIFQVCYTLAVMQDKYMFMHNDMHPGNILVDRVKKGGNIHYKFGDTDYYVDNTGFIAKIWDFEFSNIYKEGYEDYENPIEFDFGYNAGYDIHKFLRGLLDLDLLPVETREFIDSLYPCELLYSIDGVDIGFIQDDSLTIDAMNLFKLPTPRELLSHQYFSIYKINNKPIVSPSYCYKLCDNA